MHVPKTPNSSDLIWAEQGQWDEHTRANDEKHTRRGDFSSGLHDNIKHAFDCCLVISKVVRSRDRCRRIRSQVRGGNGTRVYRSGRIGDVHGRHVVFVASGDCDVVDLSGLQNDGYKLVNVGVHIQAPRRRPVQKIEKRACRVESTTALQKGESQKSYSLGSQGEWELDNHNGTALG